MHSGPLVADATRYGLRPASLTGTHKAREVIPQETVELLVFVRLPAVRECTTHFE